MGQENSKVKQCFSPDCSKDSRPKSKYCSERCMRYMYNYNQRLRKKREKPPQYKDCEVCGDIFLLRKGNWKICNKESCKAVRDKMRRTRLTKEQVMRGETLTKSKMVIPPEFLVRGLDSRIWIT